ncbi:hypothetical protein PsorP6_006137 [Peronosclerospora sorghi]|uniref:Uncharacterized protein n=1 Tax=Peronosclerospora sorghi TaxID=230839 RepID=A0ACC0W4V9_9STRA|nr:hypothetical protein PsorP6_006137 [Peronosclerospora sorghi]
MLASPGREHFSTLMTPRQHGVITSGGPNLVSWEKYVEIGRVVLYLMGSLFFLIGSIYFYPDLTVKWNGNAGTYASWAYVFGCIMFFFGANLDLIQAIRYNHGTRLRQVMRAFNTLCNYMATCIFILGALYFLPTWYINRIDDGKHYMNIAITLYVIGSVFFTISALASIPDVYRGIKQSAKDPIGDSNV